ncbi:hypothetical protein ACFX13_022733 [Malus domestica]
MPELISPSHNAFIYGRQIQDNINLAHEVFHFLKLRKAKHWFELAIKLDMNKAYDHVEWDFLETVLRKMSFCEEWVKVVMRYIKVFSRIIKRAADLGFLDGIQLSMNGPMLTHLLFADDTLMFLKATPDNCQNISNLLRAYCHASTSQLAKIDDPRVYLGIPRIWGRSKCDTLAYIKERVLAKAVAQAIPTYPMNVFQLPIHLCREIDVILAKFWWGNRNKKRGIRWVNWEDMGCAKTDGGMGFLKLMDFNTTLLAKQCWRLIHELYFLWARVLKDRYFPHDSFLNVKLGRASVMGMLLVGDSQEPDRLIWPVAKNGIYSVKPGYIWVHRPYPRGRSSRPSSSRTVENVV